MVLENRAHPMWPSAENTTRSADLAVEQNDHIILMHEAQNVLRALLEQVEVKPVRLQQADPTFDCPSPGVEILKRIPGLRGPVSQIEIGPQPPFTFDGVEREIADNRHPEEGHGDLTPLTAEFA